MSDPVALEDIADAARLIAFGMRPKLIPSRDLAYADLVKRFVEDDPFRKLAGAVAEGLGVVVLAASPRTGVVLGPVEDSVFEQKFDDYARRAILGDRRDLERVLHGLAHIATAALAFPRPDDLAADTYVGRVSVEQIDNVVREACTMLAGKAAAAEEAGDGPALGRRAVDRITGSSLQQSQGATSRVRGEDRDPDPVHLRPAAPRHLARGRRQGRQLDPLVSRRHQASRRPLHPLPGHPARGDPMTEHYRWETTLDQRRRADPGIDDPARRAAARDIRNARDIGYHLAQMRKQRGMTQAEVARAMGVSQARVSRMEHGDIEKMQVESVAAYVAAIGGHLRLVADFDQATTTFIDYTDALTA
jgi:predicted XRE-type DNA-binding protein